MQQKERELAARILGALASTEADEEEGGVSGGAQRELDMPHLLGIVQMHGNLPAQKAAAEQIAEAVSTPSASRWRPFKGP